jgi:hypothetical protein
MAHDRLGQYDERLGWRLRPHASGHNRGREFQHEIHTNSRGSQYNKPYFLPAGEGLELYGVPVPYTVLKDQKVPVTTSPQFGLHDWLDSHSTLDALVFHRLATVASLRQRWQESGLLHRQVLVFGPEEVRLLRQNLDPEFVTSWVITERLLWRWRDVAHQHGAIPVVVIIPTHLQVYPEIWRETIAKYQLDERRYDLDAPNRRLVDVCAEADLAVLDLLPPLRWHATTALPLYYRQDPHWTPEGHQVVANVIARFLREEILPGLDHPDREE